jgi:predicted aldo/keto reductase-like oxidoreductase
MEFGTIRKAARSFVRRERQKTRIMVEIKQVSCVRKINRRRFLEVGAGSLAAGYIGSYVSQAQAQEEASGAMPKRRLGRTNLQVSIVGFSGCRLISRPGGPLPQETADHMVAKALDHGINLVDTAYEYGDGQNEKTLRVALGPRRKEVILFCRLPFGSVPKGNRTVMQATEASLKRLGTDRIEVFGFHGKALTEKTAQRFIENELGDYVKARKQGKIGFIGVSGHLCTTGVMALMKTGEIDVIEIPISPVRREFLEEVLPLAKKMDIGVISMKSLTAYTLDLGCLAKPCPELTGIFGTNPGTFYRRVLSFSFAQDVACVLVGTQSVREVEMSAEAARAYRGLTEQEEKRTKFGAEREAKDFCRMCNVCLPCPEGIAIPDILRLEIDARLYGLEKWAKLDYQRRKLNAAACTRCRRCTERCPYCVPAQDLILRAAEVFA